MKNYWTKSKVDKLSSMWAKGIPAREIANKLGNVSRNAVIGRQIDLVFQKKQRIKRILMKIIMIILIHLLPI